MVDGGFAEVLAQYPPALPGFVERQFVIQVQPLAEPGAARQFATGTQIKKPIRMPAGFLMGSSRYPSPGGDELDAIP